VVERSRGLLSYNSPHPSPLLLINTQFFFSLPSNLFIDRAFPLISKNLLEPFFFSFSEIFVSPVPQGEVEGTLSPILPPPPSPPGKVVSPFLSPTRLGYIPLFAFWFASLSPFDRIHPLSSLRLPRRVVVNSSLLFVEGARLGGPIDYCLSCQSPPSFSSNIVDASSPSLIPSDLPLPKMMGGLCLFP